jgi:ABC-type glycerol-3-phosphate transport system permease component
MSIDTETTRPDLVRRAFQGQLFADVDAEWNAMMAAAIIYVLPPIALLFALRRYVAASLTMVSARA